MVNALMTQQAENTTAHLDCHERKKLLLIETSLPDQTAVADVAPSRGHISLPELLLDAGFCSKFLPWLMIYLSLVLLSHSCLDSADLLVLICEQPSE